MTWIYSLYLPFDGSPTCSAKAWVVEMCTYLQQHQVFEEEAIRVAALHFEGKAYAWWMFESFSLKNVNTSSFAKFTKILVERFDTKHETIKPMKLFHKLGGPANSKPLQKPIGGDHIFHDTLLEARSLFHNLGKEGMRVPFVKEDPLIEKLPPIHIEDEEKDGGYNTVTYRAYLVPHAEGGGAHAPTGGFLVSLQEVP